VRQLARSKAAVNAAEPDGTTALHWAVQANNVELVTLLLRAGANVKTPNRYGVPPIHAGRHERQRDRRGRAARSRRRRQHGHAAGEPVLLTAARTGDGKTVQALLKRGAQVNTREQWFGENAMMWAAAENHADVVKALAAAGGEVNGARRCSTRPCSSSPAAAVRTRPSRAAAGRR
jgi:ankyrin repeat protein